MLATAVVCVSLLLGGCLPKPESVKERRENFERSALKGRYLLDAAPADVKHVFAEFGGKAQLIGYTVTPEHPKGGDRLDIKFYWTALGPIAEDYQIFVHGDGIGGNASRIHGDHFPADGKYPTDVWREGDVVVDPMSLDIPPGYGPPQLAIFVGLYLGNYRVPLTSKGSAPADNDNRSQAITLQLN